MSSILRQKARNKDVGRIRAGQTAGGGNRFAATVDRRRPLPLKRPAGKRRRRVPCPRRRNPPGELLLPLWGNSPSARSAPFPPAGENCARSSLSTGIRFAGLPAEVGRLTYPAGRRHQEALCPPGIPGKRRLRWRCGSSCRHSPAAPQLRHCRLRR